MERGRERVKERPLVRRKRIRRNFGLLESRLLVLSSLDWISVGKRMATHKYGPIREVKIKY